MKTALDLMNFLNDLAHEGRDLSALSVDMEGCDCVNDWNGEGRIHGVWLTLVRD